MPLTPCVWMTLQSECCGEFIAADAEPKQYTHCGLCGKLALVATIVDSKFGGRNFTTRSLPYFERKERPIVSFTRLDGTHGREAARYQ